MVDGSVPTGSARATAIGSAVARLRRLYLGKGPRTVRTIIDRTTVVVIAEGGFTAAEQTLVERGRGDTVREQRLVLCEVLADDVRREIEYAMGTRVRAQTCSVEAHTETVVDVFVLEETPR